MRNETDLTVALRFVVTEGKAHTRKALLNYVEKKASLFIESRYNCSKKISALL